MLCGTGAGFFIVIRTPPAGADSVFLSKRSWPVGSALRRSVLTVAAGAGAGCVSCDELPPGSWPALAPVPGATPPPWLGWPVPSRPALLTLPATSPPFGSLFAVPMAAAIVATTSTAEIPITILVPGPLPGKSCRMTPIVLRITAQSARQTPSTWNAVMSVARTSTAGNLPLAAVGCRRRLCNTPRRCCPTARGAADADRRGAGDGRAGGLCGGRHRAVHPRGARRDRGAAVRPARAAGGARADRPRSRVECCVPSRGVRARRRAARAREADARQRSPRCRHPARQHGARRAERGDRRQARRHRQPARARDELPRPRRARDQAARR